MSKVIAELLSVAIRSSPRIKGMLVILPDSQPFCSISIVQNCHQVGTRVSDKDCV